MNYFASKKEALVTAVIAAFFVLVAFVFTIEPLVSIILANRTIPLKTTSLLVVSSGAKTSDILAAVGKQDLKSELFAKTNDFLEKLSIQSIAVQDRSFAISTARPSEQVTTNLRKYLSRLSPTDIKTLLPDGTFMTETVIDPILIKVKTGKTGVYKTWTFTQTNPQVVIQENGLNSDILINNPQVGDIHGFESPATCSSNTNKIRTIGFNTTRKPLISAFLTSFLAYFKHYSCFQSFSTFNQK
jgi:hypothetical protein